MNITLKRGARAVVLMALVGALASCAIPRSGPNKREIFAGSVQKQGDAFVVAVNDHVTRATAVVPAFGFTPAFINAGLVGSDTIQPGDTLGLTIWENVDDGLLAGAGQSATTLEEVQVDGSGFIYVPYAGRVKAAGNTPEAIRRIITEKLEGQTPDPQVLVRRLAGDGSTVSVTGAVGGQGVFAIERPTRTLSRDAGARRRRRRSSLKSRRSRSSAATIRPRSGSRISTRTPAMTSRCAAATGFWSRPIPAPSLRSGATGAQSRVDFDKPGAFGDRGNRDRSVASVRTRPTRPACSSSATSRRRSRRRCWAAPIWSVTSG